jgi:hypothetical protein
MESLFGDLPAPKKETATKGSTSSGGTTTKQVDTIKVPSVTSLKQTDPTVTAAVTAGPTSSGGASSSSVSTKKKVSSTAFVPAALRKRPNKATTTTTTSSSSSSAVVAPVVQLSKVVSQQPTPEVVVVAKNEKEKETTIPSITTNDHDRSRDNASSLGQEITDYNATLQTSAIDNSTTANVMMDVEDLYDPAIPNDLLQYRERQAAIRHRQRLQAQQAQALADQEALRQQAIATRQALIQAGQLDVVVAQENAALASRGRGRGISNLPAWMIKKQQEEQKQRQQQ